MENLYGKVSAFYMMEPGAVVVDPADAAALVIEEKKEKEDDDEEEKKEEEEAAAEEKSDTKSEKEVDDAMEGGALPDDEEGDFKGIAGDEVVEAAERVTIPGEGIDVAVKGSSAIKFFERLFNEGNLLDMAAEVERQNAMGAPIVEWIALVASIISMTTNVGFRLGRAMLFRDASMQADAVDSAVQRLKYLLLQGAGVPQGVSASRLSWDAISFKIPQNGLEFFLQAYPAGLDELTQEDAQTIVEIEDLVERTVKEKAAEYRNRTQSVQDEFITDLTLYFEQQIGGADYNIMRTQRIAQVGYGKLSDYVAKMYNVFLTGNLPSAIPPSKIYACHDIISQAELRATIQKVAKDQMDQQAAMLENKHTKGRAFYNSYQTQQFSHAAEASILLRKTGDMYQKRILSTLGVNYGYPQTELRNYLAGGSNNLGKYLELGQNRVVRTDTPGNLEVLKHYVSTLLACLRMRANATVKSEWELMTDDDLDHLEIVRFLTQTSSSLAATGSELHNMATMLQNAFAKGHNLSRFAGKLLPTEAQEGIKYSVEGRTKIIARKIKCLDTDILSNGPLFDVFMSSINKSLALKHRIDMERAERIYRRTAGAIASKNELGV